LIVSTILIVEDDLHARDGLCELLSEEGYEVKPADSASAAMQSINPDVALILSDLDLPDSSGLELCETLKKRNPNLKSIIMTAYAPEDVYRRAKKLGINSWLIKPLDIDLLLRLIKQVLNPAMSHQMTDAAPEMRWIN